MRVALACMALSLLLFGCSSVQPTAKAEQGSFPKMGVLTTVNVGDVMIEEHNFIGQEQAILLQQVTGSFWRGRQPLPSGAALQKMTKDGKTYFCPLATGYGSGCLADTNNDSTFDKAYTVNAFGAPVNSDTITPVPYRLTTGMVQSGFKYELVYQGIEGDVVNVAYREYSGDMARPAFYQDLNYTLDKPNTTVSFRDIRFTIHSADNSQINYTVRSGIN